MAIVIRALLLVFASVALLPAPLLATVWTPPVGVPAPSFGITQTAGAHTHYVDNTHPSATDSGNGTPSRPRRTIPSSVPAGSVVEVHGGPYSISTDVRFSGSGTAAQPVFYRGVGAPILQGPSGTREVELAGSYVIFEGFVLDRTQVILDGHHIALRSSEVRNYDPGGNSAALTGSGTDLVLYANDIHHNGDPESSSERDIHGVKFSSGTSNLWIVENHIHENGGDEIQLGNQQSGEPWLHHVYVGRNVGHGSRENCVDVKQARDVIISENECYDYQSTGSSEGAAMVFHYNPERIWILNNSIHDAAFGVKSSSSGSGGQLAIVGNRFYRIHHAPGSSYDARSAWSEGHAVIAWATANLEIVNNTMHDVDAGISFASGSRPNLRIVNNLISSLAETSHHVFVAGDATPTTTISHSLLRSPSRIKWGSTSNVRTIASFQSAYPGQCGGCTDQDPQFVSEASYDLRPLSGSPTIDAGTTDPVYARFSTRYGLDIRYDPDGASRPQGSAWDIGAHEYGGAPTPPLPLITVADAGVVEGDSGTQLLLFTVSLSVPSRDVVSVTYATQDGTALASQDYVAQSGVLGFGPGVTARTIAVAVIGDAAPESDETLLVNLGGPTGGILVDSQGSGTILNDDGPPAPPEQIEASSLDVDPLGNTVLEPAEVASMNPAWRNLSGSSVVLSGSLMDFTGPGQPDPAYAITDGTADYGTVASGATASCAAATGDCHSLLTSQPTYRPATHWDAVATETLSNGQSKDWTIHIGDSFDDVPRASPFYPFIETLLHHSVTSGCSATGYCPTLSTTRAQMALFVLRAKEGPRYSPPACGSSPAFADVPASDSFCPWVEELARRGAASGCGGGYYCPDASVTRAQMAVFVLKTLDPSTAPPAGPTPMFNDVPLSDPFRRWIEELARRGVVIGCGGGNYCPTSAVTREQMGVFIGKGFELSLYGP